jgi:hypothetical protein
MVRGRGAPITFSGALKQIFGAKSRSGRGIVFPQGTLSVRVTYFLSDLAPLHGGAIFFLKNGRAIHTPTGPLRPALGSSACSPWPDIGTLP